jgi:hypothetical protein
MPRAENRATYPLLEAFLVSFRSRTVLMPGFAMANSVEASCAEAADAA